MLDLFSLFSYLGLIFFLRWKTAIPSSEFNPENQYLAGQKLSIFASLGSLIGTEVSALTFVGLPAFALTQDLSFLGIYIGAFFARVLIARFFLPFYWKNKTTTYSCLAPEAPQLQQTMGLIFVLGKILSVGVRFYSGTILVSHFFQFPPALSICVVALITAFYTLSGGLRSIVVTDIWQMCLLVCCGLLFFVQLSQFSIVTLDNLVGLASDRGKLTVVNDHFFMAILGGFFLDLFSHGIDQDYVQRLLALPKLKSAQLTILLSSFFSIFVGLLFLLVGIGLWGLQETSQMVFGPADEAFVAFILETYPEGLKGLMVAGVLAATMSTLDSTMNAVASVFHFNTNFFPQEWSFKRRNFLYHGVATFLLVIVALLSIQSKQVLILGLKLQTWVGAPFLALLALSLFHQTASINSKIFSMVFILNLGTIYCSHILLGLSWHFNLLISGVISFASLYCAQILNGKAHARNRSQ